MHFHPSFHVFSTSSHGNTSLKQWYASRKTHLQHTTTQRSPAEVRAKKDAKLAAKAEKEAQKQNGLQEAAKIEEQTHQKMQRQKNHTGILTSSKLSIPHKQNEQPAQNAKGCF